MLLDGETLDLSPAVETALERRAGDPRFRREIRLGQIESVTPVSGNARAAALHLAQARLDLDDAVRPAVAIAASGTHPFSADWGDVPDDERYRQLAEEFPSAVLGNVPCGLHVHVGFGPAPRVLAVYNAVRSFLPELAALAANSPFAEGKDVGLASARRPLVGAFHRTGIPPAFTSWDAFFELVDWARRGGLLPDGTHLWWDLRPHTRYGTLELRVTDAQTRVEDAAAIAGVFQTLVVVLARTVDRGDPLPVHDTLKIEENAWRAIRYGVRGTMVDLDTGVVEPARDRLGRLLERLEPVAADLGNLDSLHTAHLLLADNGAERQRYVCARLGLYGLTRWLADETVRSAQEYLSQRV